MDTNARLSTAETWGTENTFIVWIVTSVYLLRKRKWCDISSGTGNVRNHYNMDFFALVQWMTAVKNSTAVHTMVAKHTTTDYRLVQGRLLLAN